jgi:hypothetical protein
MHHHDITLSSSLDFIVVKDMEPGDGTWSLDIEYQDFQRD